MRDIFTAEHVEHVATGSFDEVTAALESATGDVQNGIPDREATVATDGADYEQRMRQYQP